MIQSLRENPGDRSAAAAAGKSSGAQTLTMVLFRRFTDLRNVLVHPNTTSLVNFDLIFMIPTPDVYAGFSTFGNSILCVRDGSGSGPQESLTAQKYSMAPIVFWVTGFHSGVVTTSIGRREPSAWVAVTCCL